MSEPLSAATLTAIEARVNAATPGEWVAVDTGRKNGSHWYVVSSGEAIASIHANDGSDEVQREPDAEFIAHARTDIPLLLAEVRRLQGMIDGWKIVSKARAEKSTDEKADAWDEGFEEGFEWALHQSTPSGVSIDPPVNPYGAFRALLDGKGEGK